MCVVSARLCIRVVVVVGLLARLMGRRVLYTGTNYEISTGGCVTDTISEGNEQSFSNYQINLRL